MAAVDGTGPSKAVTVTGKWAPLTPDEGDARELFGGGGEHRGTVHTQAVFQPHARCELGFSDPTRLLILPSKSPAQPSLKTATQSCAPTPPGRFAMCYRRTPPTSRSGGPQGTTFRHTPSRFIPRRRSIPLFSTSQLMLRTTCPTTCCRRPFLTPPSITHWNTRRMEGQPKCGA